MSLERLPLPILTELPQGYTVWSEARAVAAIADEYVTPLAALGVTASADGAVQQSDLHGRQALFEYRLGERSVVVRRFNHGGLFRWATGKRFRDPARQFRELIVSEALRAAGFLTPKVVGARARLASGGGWYLELLTERVKGVDDLGVVLERARRAELSFAERRGVTRALARLLARLHSFGLAHADLQPRNLLVPIDNLADDSLRLWVIDLDRSKLRESLSEEQRLSNMRRLFRSVERRSRNALANVDSETAGFVGRSDYARFLRTYQKACGAHDWRADWRAIQSAHARRSLAHRVGQALERRFSDATERLGVERGSH